MVIASSSSSHGKRSDKKARKGGKKSQDKVRDPLAGSARKRKEKEGAVLPGAGYWRRINPGLHCGDADFQARSQPLILPPERLEILRKQLIRDGFFTLAPEEMAWAASLKAMRIGARRLVRRGWPASLLMVYDEVWSLSHQLSSLMASVSGGCTNSFDMLAYSILPCLGQSGFAPHRDRQPADVAGSFRADGTPKYCTAWIALSHATTENSCLYVVPRAHDPGYDAGDDHAADAEDPLINLFKSSDAAVQAVRACPLRAGGTIIFSHRIMHWGSKGDPDCDKDRISVTFGHSEPRFEPPYLATPQAHLPFPKAPLRLALASAQLINYHERFEFGFGLLRRLGSTFRARKGLFTREYAQKTAAEFKDACEDSTTRHRAATSAARGASARKTGASSEDDDDEEGLGQGGSDLGDDSEDADAAIDDALEAMLDAQADADETNLYDDFEDYASEEEEDEEDD
jgi:hypothetical protein